MSSIYNFSVDISDGKIFELAYAVTVETVFDILKEEIRYGDQL